MRAIIDFDKVKEATDEFARPMGGGYIITIMGVKDEPAKERLELYYDIASGANGETAAFAGFYKARFESKGYGYPRFWRYYTKKAQGYFKGFINAVSKDNPGFTWKWDENDLIGKSIGVVLAEEEYLYEGEKRIRLNVDRVLSVEKILAGDFKVPPIKKLDEEPSTANNAAAPANYNDVPF